MKSATYSNTAVPKEKFAENLTYDKMGNITSIKRDGLTGQDTYGAIDDLTFGYTGNQLLYIADMGASVSLSASADFKEYSKVTTAEYAFNRNGAMTKDLNKGIVSREGTNLRDGISYNALNLPVEMVINNDEVKAKNYYTYTATGTKLKVIRRYDPKGFATPLLGTTPEKDGLNPKNTTDYVGNKIYEDGVLKMILTDNGYIEGNSYYFYIKDHLGNNRVVANASGGAIQSNQFYPFGMAFAEGTTTEQGKQPYKYNGKELDQIHGLNLYDYSARYYDPAYSRFTTMDPLAEKYYSISPYAYVGNNPIKFIDPTGMELMLFKNGVYVGSHDDGKKEVTGFNQRSTTNKDGTEKFTGADNFSFNDIELDRGALESGSMTLSFMSSDDVNNIIGQSGANDQSALSRWGYTARESNANNLSGNGKLDFRTYPQISDESHLYIVNSVGYNSADAGNYLWGYAMRTMGFTETAARSAAHINAWYSAKESNGEGSQSSWGIVRAFENRSWGGDSAADQRAIKNGMNDAGGYWKHKKQTLRRQWDRMRK